VPPVGKFLERIQGIVWGDGVRDTSAYFDDHGIVIDALGRDAGKPALLVRGLDARNAPTEVFRVNKDGSVSWVGQPLDVRNYGALGDGAADDRAALLAAEAALGAGGGAVRIPPGTYKLASSTALARTTVLLLDGGATLAPAAGTTLTIRGVVRAGPYPVFAGAGTVVLSTPQLVHPEWWGAKADVQTSTTGASITASTTTLTVSWASFTSDDVGKTVVVCGAGPSGAPLITTISAIIGGTQVTLAAAASTTVSNGKVAWGTDSTTALQACLDTISTAVHRVQVSGRYGATRLRVQPYTVLEGLSQLDFSGFYRFGAGAGGPFLAATASAQGIRFENFIVDCMQVGGTLGGIELGTDSHANALASGGYLRNVKVKNALGWAFDVRANVCILENLWAQHDLALPSGPRPPAGSARSTPSATRSS